MLSFLKNQIQLLAYFQVLECRLVNLRFGLLRFSGFSENPASNAQNYSIKTDL